MTLNLLGLIYLNTERYEKAEPLLQEAMTLRTKIYPANNSLRIETLANLASVDNAMARYDEAEAKQREALRLAEARGPARSASLPTSRPIRAARSGRRRRSAAPP